MPFCRPGVLTGRPLMRPGRLGGSLALPLPAGVRRMTSKRERERVRVREREREGGRDMGLFPGDGTSGRSPGKMSIRRLKVDSPGGKYAIHMGPGARARLRDLIPRGSERSPIHLVMD